MAIVQVEVQLSSEELLKAVDQLSLPDLEQFVSQVLLLQAQRKAFMPSAEAELLLKINQGQTADKFADVLYMEEQIKAMANDLDIQAEVAAINEEFSVTEMDDLEA